MRRIVYISRSACNGSYDEIESIRTVSQANNSQDGISGLLLSDGRRFIQAIEGRRDAVGRHQSILKMQDLAIIKREFGNWAMYHRHLKTSKDAHRLRADLVELTAQVTDAHIRACFFGFVYLAL